MNNLANKTTFWSFLTQTRIRIPRIQRDYAQGRKGKENLRERFLRSIADALSGKSPQLQLDFVYGSSDGEGNFAPLDGQQRLTTLWLLHWYFAYRLNCHGLLGDDNTVEVIKNVLLRFTYETRESSKQFIQKMVSDGLKIKRYEGEIISDAIMRQSWMFTSWRQDPTVQSMLRMLSGESNDSIDGIEEVFGKEPDSMILTYWEKLRSDTGTCPIIFYQLDIDNLGQSDDLYVKMNGRGKPLTDFENFKADLIKYLEDNKWSDLLDAKNGYPILMDTKWTDFFWRYRKDEIPFDDIYFGFINRYLLSVLMRTFPDLENSQEGTIKRKIYDYLYSFIEAKSKRALYTDVGFGIYQDFFKLFGGLDEAKKVLDEFLTIMNNISNASSSMRIDSQINSPYYQDKVFTPVYVESGVKDYYSLTQPQMIAFWAMCHYFARTSDINQINNWMRIVWNSCDFNEEMRSKQSIISCIKELALCIKDPTNPYKSLSNMDPINDSELKKMNWDTAFGEHIREEKVKVVKMFGGLYTGSIKAFSGRSWEEVIRSVEKHEYLSGTIRCLLLNADGSYDWSYFDSKFNHLITYDDLGDVATRNYLIHDFERIRKDYWYPGNEINNKKHWKVILSDVNIANVLHNWLIATPLDDVQLEQHCVNVNKGYVYSMIIGSTLLRDAADKRGVYLARSWACGGKDVLIHHQASYPYVVLYEYRNWLLNQLQNVISLHNPNNWLSCKAYNGKDVWFDYNGGKYLWTAEGKIKRAESENEYRIDEKSIVDAASFQAFLITLPA